MLSATPAEANWGEPISIREGVDQLTRSATQRRAVVFAGAGVSMVPPTRLPGGAELRDEAMEFCCAAQAAEEMWESLRADPRYRALLPERVFQKIFEVLADRLLPFFRVLDGAQPNNVHRELGALCRARSVAVITTNFELLLDAYVPPGGVLHLHGHLAEPISLVVRINQVGLGLSRDIQLKLNQLLRDKELFVLGYSGRDADVVDGLTKAAPRSVWWLVRTGSAIPDLSKLAKGTKIRFIHGDLEELASYLPASRGSVGELTTPRESYPREQAPADDGRRQIREVEAFGCVAKVAAECGMFELSVTACERGLEADPDPHRRAWLATTASESLRLAGDFESSLEWIARGLLEVGAGDLVQQAALHNGRGLLWLEQGEPNPARARESFERALRAHRRFMGTEESSRWGSQNQVLLGMIYNNLGWSHQHAGDLKKAEAAYREALRQKRAAGDVISQAQTAVNLSIALYEHREYRKSGYWRRVALPICRRFGLVVQEAELWRGLGELACQRGRIGRGRHWLHRAERLLRDTEHHAAREATQKLLSQWMA